MYFKDRNWITKTVNCISCSVVCKIVFYSEFPDIPDNAGKVTKGRRRRRRRTQAIAKRYVFHANAITHNKNEMNDTFFFFFPMKWVLHWYIGLLMQHTRPCYIVGHVLTSFKSLKIVLINIFGILMISAKLATLQILKINAFWNKSYDVIISVPDFINKVLWRDSIYNVVVVMWPKLPFL